MFGNYLKTTLRNLSGNILYVIINVIALGLALSICIVAYLNSKYDADWDRMHRKGDEIYKVIFTRDIQGRQQAYGLTPLPLASMIGETYSGVEHVIRFHGSESPLKVGIDNFSKRIGYADPDFLDVFSFAVVRGSPEAFRDRQNILINQSIASIYFGDEDPVGRLMSVFNDQGKEFTYTVGGVFEDIPLNSSFSFEVLTQFENFLDMWEIDPGGWETWVSSTFLHIPASNQVETVEELLQEITPVYNKARENFQISEFRLLPLFDVSHEAWNMVANWWVTQSFHPAAVKAPPVMALLILLIACFNFTNTAISFSSKRLKEIGVRKVAGGHRKQIIVQFMTENLVLTSLGLLLALFIARILVPLYSSMWVYMDLEYSLLDNPPLILFLVLLLIITTIFAGAYPSFYISRFNPVNIFQDKLKIGGKNVFSVILLTLQVGISIQAINSGILFAQNARFQDNQYQGYDKDQVIGMNIASQEYFTAFRDRIKTNPMILSVGESDEHIGRSGYARDVEYEGIKESVSFMDIGEGYFETMGLRLMDGRTFTREFEKTDKENSIMVNEKFVADFGLGDPLGTRITMADTLQVYIVGIVGDFYPFGFWNEIEPLAFRPAQKDRLRFLTVKAEIPDLQEVNEFMEAQWKEMIPTHPYGGFFQDDLMNEARQVNKNIKNIYLFLAFIALVLAAIGLYTMVSLSVIRRTKEIGVRKVMGSTIPGIILILSRPYAIIIGIACIIGLAGGHYSGMAIMTSIWKAHTNATAFTFLLPVLLILVVAFASIGWKVYAAASRNPTDSLRYE